MKLTSSVFEDGGSIPSKYTCDGKSTNPPLTISDVPVGIKSLTLIVEDPDVPKYIRPDGLWVHWVVFNISPTTTEIKEEVGCDIKDIYPLGIIKEYTLDEEGNQRLQKIFCYKAKVSGSIGVTKLTASERERGIYIDWMPLNEALLYFENAPPSMARSRALLILA